MSERFWRLVDRLLPAGLRDSHPERRARARLLAAFCILTAFAGAGMTPIDALAGTANPLVTASATLSAVLFLVLLRVTGAVDVVATLFILALAFAGSAMNAIEPLPGAPYKAWVLVLGFTPLVGPSVRSTLAITLAAIALCFAIPAPPGTTPTLIPPGDMFFMVMAAWLGMVFVIDTHRMALGEHAAELDTQRAAEREINASTQELEAEARDTLSFLTTVSHELRTPLNGVIGVSSLISDEDVPDASRADLVEIQRSSRSVLRIFDTLLHLTRTTADGAGDIQPADLPAVMDAVVATISHGAPEAEIGWSVAPELPRVVGIDAPALHVILCQLVGCAADAGVGGLSLDARALGKELVIIARGRPPQTDGTPLELGLSLVGELAARHDGHMTVDREGGFQVALTFPCRPVDVGPITFTASERDTTMAG